MSRNLSWNHTLICLVPKTSFPSEVHHFRPIGLCTTLYKIVTKILVRHLKPIIPHLISFNQGAFVPRRKECDNIIIAQEISNNFLKKKGDSNAWMMIKLDLKKTYDKINWDFIYSALALFHFPQKWITLITICISYVQHSIIVKSCLSDFFSPKWGIRQGDPLSPYLFILCMELLTSLINKEVAGKRWTPISFKDVKISHLLYADDVLLFAKVNKKTIKSIDSSLKSFLSFSSLNVN